jgi:hypothetical protein
MQAACKFMWKWLSFSGWLVWFFATLPWQLRKGYAQVLGSTSFSGAKGEKALRYPLSRRYYDNLN